MCGRYLITSHTEAIPRLLKVDQLPNIGASFNVAPTQQVQIVRVSNRARELVTAAEEFRARMAREHCKTPACLMKLAT